MGAGPSAAEARFTQLYARYTNPIRAFCNRRVLPDAVGDARNADEIRFWADDVAGTDTSWIVDDAGIAGGLAPDSEFVIVGDLNSDPVDGDSIPGATQQVLDLDRVQDPLPMSDGAVEAELQGGANASQQGDPATDTADFSDEAPGNLPADHVLPFGRFRIVDTSRFLAADERRAVSPRHDRPGRHV